jgi:hypothetical protein
VVGVSNNKIVGGEEMNKETGAKGITRRQLLLRASAAGASFIVGSGFLAAKNAAWATELSILKPRTFATLAQMARDIYPHDQISEEFYVIAVKSYDTPDASEDIEAGIAALDAAAREKGYASYLDTAWERDRVDILRGMEESIFFQKIRGGLVTGLYNQKAVWPVFGYEGESYSKGGYIDRGFNDINWL